MSSIKLLSRAQLKSLKAAIEADHWYETGQIPLFGDSFEQDKEMDDARAALDLTRYRRLHALKLIRAQQDWIRNSMKIAKAWNL